MLYLLLCFCKRNVHDQSNNGLIVSVCACACAWSAMDWFRFLRVVFLITLIRLAEQGQSRPNTSQLTAQNRPTHTRGRTSISDFSFVSIEWSCLESRLWPLTIWDKEEPIEVANMKTTKVRRRRRVKTGTSSLLFLPKLGFWIQLEQIK